MLIILGKKISQDKIVRYGLTEIFGIGITSATLICKNLSIPLKLKIKDLTENQKLNISRYIKKNYIIENRLKKQTQNHINNFIENNSIRGFRHRLKLPVNGQRTHSNAKTCRKVSHF